VAHFEIVPGGASQQTYKHCQQIHKIKLTQTSQTLSQTDTAIFKMYRLDARLYYTNANRTFFEHTQDI